MVKLKKLVINGFRSFEEAVVVFPESGMMLLEGDSGHGKSTVLLAIAFVLDIAPPEYTQADLASWRGTPMKVALMVDKNGTEYTFTRGKTATVTCPDWSAPKTGSKAYAEQLQSVFGCQSVILSSLVYRAQDTHGHFLSMGDLDRKEYLTELLGLAHIEKLAADAEANANQLDNQIVGLRATIATRNELIKGMTPAPLDLTTTEMLHDSVNESKAIRDANKAKFDLVDAEVKRRYTEVLLAKQTQADDIQTKLDKLAVFAKEVKAKDAQGLAEHRQREVHLEKKWRALAQSLDRLIFKDIELEKARKNLASVVEGICFTCKQPWTVGCDDVPGLQSQIADLEELISTRPSLQVAVAEADAERKALGQFQPSEAGVKLMLKERDLQAQLKEAQSGRINDVAFDALQANLQVLQMALSRSHHAAASAEAELLQAERTNAYKQKTYDDAMRKIAVEQKLVAEKEIELAGLLAEFGAEKDLAQGLGRAGFLGVIFDEVLNEIADEANVRLASLTNVNNVTITFQSEWENKSGKTRRTIVPVMSIGGQTAKYKTGLSGGMRTSVDQVVDLACRVVVGRRTGATPGFLLLDEAFNGQPSKTKEAAMEVLKEFAKDNLVVVIDHSSEFKELFTQVVKVVKSNEVSTIED